MSKCDDLSKNIMEALKNKDTVRLNVLRLIKGAIQLEHINNKRELDDDLFTEVVVKQIKERNESMEEFKKGNRQDLIDKTEEEIKILNEYLPEQLSEEEVLKIVDEIFDEVKPEGQKDMGKIMKLCQEKLKGKTDMKEVSSIVRSKLV